MSRSAEHWPRTPFFWMRIIEFHLLDAQTALDGDTPLVGAEIETHPGSNIVRDLALPTVVGHIPYGGACVVRKSMSI